MFFNGVVIQRCCKTAGASNLILSLWNFPRGVFIGRACLIGSLVLRQERRHLSES